MLKSEVRKTCGCVVEGLERRQLLSSVVTATLLDEQFNGNLKSWYMHKWDESTYFGRTQLKTPENEPMPKIVNGAVRLTLDSYNRTMLPGLPSFYGTQIISKKSFKINNGLSVRFRAKLNDPVSKGIVGGLFFYQIKNPTNHNELDVELLGNQYKSGKNMVNTNVYKNEGFGAGSPAFYSLPKGGKLNGWHVYEIKCYPNKVEWWIDSKRVRTETEKVPTSSFQVYLNIWAPAEDWSDAYSSTIKPVSKKSQNKTWSMDVDSVLVRSIKGPSGDVSAPTPNPSTFSQVPIAEMTDTVSMTAQVANDSSGVQYYFHNVTDEEHDSGWVSSPNWTDTELEPGTTYSYQVKTRDLSVNHNTTGYSEVFSVTTPLVDPAPGINITSVTSGYLYGKVSYIRPSEYKNFKVAVFIRVFGGWWTKPYWNNPASFINSDGSFSADVVTGGYDSSADLFRAYLVPSDFSIPGASGGGIPSSIASYTYAER